MLNSASRGSARPVTGPVDRRLIKALPGLRAGVAAAVAMGLVSTAAVVAQAVALGHLLASAMPGAAAVDRARWLALFAVGVAVRALIAFLGELVAAATCSRAIAALRAGLVRATLHNGGGQSRGPRPAEELGDGAPSRPGDNGRGWGRGPRPAEELGDGAPSGPGDIATLAGRGLDALEVYIGRCLPDMVLAAAAPLALLAAVGVLDWLSALVMVVIVALFPVFGALVGRASLTLAGQRWRQVEELGCQIGDLFEGLPVLRAYGRTADQRQRMARANDILSRSGTKVLRVAFLSALVLDTLGSVSVALVAVPLGLRLLTGNVSLSAALAVLIVAPEVFLPLRRASSEFHESTEGLAASARALAVIGGVPAQPDLAVVATASGHAPVAEGGRVLHQRVPPSPAHAVVELRAVSVELTGRPAPVLRHASLAISPGETVVLVGPSGAGKSTVVSLLLGFSAPSAGEVTVGGQDVGDTDLSVWRQMVTYLPEHPTLLAASLADNLRLADQAATDEELLVALDRAGAPELVGSVPDGLATMLGDGGRPVSAGERQRIALARVFLRPRPLYLLDEPTVHLDPAAEAHVVASLREALAGRSALVVSHRPALLGLADRVLAVRDGELVDVTVELAAHPQVSGVGA